MGQSRAPRKRKRAHAGLDAGDGAQPGPETPAMNAPEVQAFLLCDEASRDPKSSKYRITGVFDMIAVQALPAEHRSMEAYVRIRLPAGMDEAQLRFVVVTPSGVRSETEAQVSWPKVSSRIIEGSFRLRKFPITEMGTYVLELLVNGEPAAEYPFGIVESGRPADAPLH